MSSVTELRMGSGRFTATVTEAFVTVEVPDGPNGEYSTKVMTVPADEADELLMLVATTRETYARLKREGSE